MQERGEWVVHTEHLSHFSRLVDAATFGRLALVETHRRGTETAKTMYACAVSDGAEWIQGFVDLHRPDAVRILDFPHALSYVAQAGQAVYGEGTLACTRWFAYQRQTLHHGSPDAVLAALRQLAMAAKRREKPQAGTTVQESLGYLAKRREMLAHAWCDARGYSLGSGSVESANKLVVERRLKGAGMHWARQHVNPMVALRAMACSDRWQEAWPQITQHVRTTPSKTAGSASWPTGRAPPRGSWPRCPPHRPQPLPRLRWQAQGLPRGRPRRPSSPFISSGRTRALPPSPDHP
ncbi:MAG TPA: hypothetical protein VGC99_21315 [Candidatus Tectomicrobia bacterium]